MATTYGGFITKRELEKLFKDNPGLSSKFWEGMKESDAYKRFRNPNTTPDAPIDVTVKQKKIIRDYVTDQIGKWAASRVINNPE